MGGSESRGGGEAGPPPKVGDGKDVEDDLRAELAQARIDLAQEQRRTRSLEDELRSARERSLAAQKQLEEEEELVTNKLMKRLAGLLIYGSPYLWEELQPLLNSTIPALYSPGQMPVAQRLALGQLLPESAAGFSADFTD